jgi:hypothetical protein
VPAAGQRAPASAISATRILTDHKQKEWRRGSQDGSGCSCGSPGGSGRGRTAGRTLPGQLLCCDNQERQTGQPFEDPAHVPNGGRVTEEHPMGDDGKSGDGH